MFRQIAIRKLTLSGGALLLLGAAYFIYPQVIFAQHQGAPPELPANDKIDERDKKKAAGQYAKRARYLLDQMELERAERDLRRSLELNPNAEAYLYMAELSDYREKTVQADEYLQKALVLVGDDWQISYKIAHLYRQMKMFSKAGAILRRALVVNSSDFIVRTWYAECLYADKHYSEAIAEVNKVLAKSPPLADIIKNSSRDLKDPGLRFHYSTWNDLSFSCYATRGGSLLSLDRAQEAMADLDKAQRLHVNDKDVLALRVQAMEKLGKVGKAAGLKVKLNQRRDQDSEFYKDMMGSPGK